MVFIGSVNLPKVHIIATGGTIAGSAASAISVDYEPSKKNIEELLAALPELHTLAQISAEQIYNIDSQDITYEAWLLLARRVNAILADVAIDGVVITHGTDTMEETAYFLNLVVKSNKPVVLVGAMRPATSLSADGPMNLYQAVLVASDKIAHNRGVMVVMNGQIFPARDVTKVSTTQVDAFRAPNWGAMGEIRDGGVHFFHSPLLYKHTLATPFHIENSKSLPQVAILYTYAAIGEEWVSTLIRTSSVEGIVVAGVGNGNIPQIILPFLTEGVARGKLIVRATRIATGSITRQGEIDDKQLGFIAALDLNPQKARILLSLGLTLTRSREEIERYFTLY